MTHDDVAMQRAIAGLVRELGALRRRVELVESQAGAQQALVGFDPDPGQITQVIPQRIETNPDPEVVERWNAHLAAWVPWLVDTYRLHETIPPCWPEHPQLVEELTASWLMWRDAWLTPTSPSAPATWHIALANMIGRLKSLWPVACMSGRHKDVVTPAWVSASESFDCVRP